jgi:hypothetical protein
MDNPKKLLFIVHCKLFIYFTTFASHNAKQELWLTAYDF